jgi:hypothetical protein
MTATKELNDFLLVELEQFAQDFIQDRATSLRSRGAVASRGLVNSLSYEARASAVNAGVEALISFEEHGRYIDMRSLQPAEGGADYISNLISWIEAKGLADQFITKYVTDRNLQKVPENVLRHIAFGIAKKRSQGKYKRTQWYNKAKTAQISALYDSILINIPDVLVEELKKGFDPNARSASLAKNRTAAGNTRYNYANTVKNRSRNEGYSL